MVNRCFNWEACGQLQCIGIFSVKCVTQHVLCVSSVCAFNRKIMSVDLAIMCLILSWLTYYFQSSLLSLLSIVNIQSPSRQNLDVFWDFEFSWRLLLSLSSSSSSSRRASSGIHDPITPPIAILQQSREVVWKASSISTGLVDVGDCRVIVCVLTENGP